MASSSRSSFTLFNLLIPFAILLALVNAQDGQSTPTLSLGTGPTVSPSSSQPVRGPSSGPSPTSKPPFHSRPSPSSSSPPPVQKSKASSSSSLQAPTSSTPSPSSSISSAPPRSSSTSSPSSLVAPGTSAVDQSRTGLIVASTPTVANTNQDASQSTDDATPTDPPAKSVSFLQNKAAVAGTFTVVSIVGAALLAFIVMFILKKRRQRSGLDDDFDTDNWNGKRFMGRRDTYARSSFGMAAMAEKPSGHQEAVNDSYHHDDISNYSHQEIRPGPFDPYENNYALPNPGFGNESLMPAEYGLSQHQAYSQHHQQQQHNQGYGATGTSRGPLVFTGGYYANNNTSAPAPAPGSAQEPLPASNYLHDPGVVAHYTQNPYVLDSYYGGSSSELPATQLQPLHHQQPQPQPQQTKSYSSNPYRRSEPTEWGVAC